MQMDNLVKEDFSNVFDSSLVDYSEDFKRSDEIEQIYSWLDTHHGWTGRESRGLSDKELRKKLHDKYKVEIKNGIAYVSYNPGEEEKRGKEIVLNFYFDESEAEIPFILMDNPNIDSFYIRLISESYNHAKIKTALKDLKFISEIDSSKIIFRFNQVTIDNLSWVPSKWKLEFFEDENLITYDNLPVWKNTDFYFKDEKTTYRDDPLFGNKWESESMIFGVMSLGVNKDVTYEDIYKRILENVNSSCLTDDKFIHISIESNRYKYKGGQYPSYKSYVNLFKIEDKKVLIAYSKYSELHYSGEYDSWGNRKAWSAQIEQPFILENGQLKYVKIDWQNNKIIENTNINPIKRLIGESFGNVFDSSLIDYSDDFEKADERHKKEQEIKNWLLNNTNFIGIKNFIKEDKIKIHDDYSIDMPMLRCYNKTYFHHEDRNFPDFIKFNDVKTLYINSELLNHWNILSNLPKHIETIEIITGALKENKELAILLFKYSDVKKIYLYNNGEWYYSAHDIDKRIHESFENAFDSSLIDYAPDFEEQDIWYKKILSIKSWLDSYNIENYTINKDLTVDIKGNLSLSNIYIKKIKVQFNEVGGSFWCDHNRLISLKGCPKKIGAHFYCNDNQLTSLDGCPTYVGGSFTCHNNKLTSLDGCPTYVGGNFICENNQLTSDWTEEKLRSISDIKGRIFGLKSKVNESFENVFDSSLIDYAPDFEEQDKVQQIKNWMNLYAHPMDYFNHNMIEGTVDYDLEKIGDSYVINLNEGTLIFDYEATEKDAPMFIGDSFPPYIKFNKCNGDFSISPNFTATGKLSLRDCPREINGSFEITNGPCSVDVDLSEGPEYVTSNYICMQHNSGIDTCKTELRNDTICYYMLSMTTKEKEKLNDNGYLFKGMAIHYDENNGLTLDGTEKYDGEPFAWDWVLIYRIHENKKYLYGIADLGDFGLDVVEYDSPSTWRWEMMLEDPRMMSDKELSIFRKVFSTKQQRMIRRFFDKKNAELGNNINESFENVFDSSLMDYSKDFEEQDKILYQDRCDKINKWLSDMWLLKPDEDGNERSYKINSDFTIDASGHIDIDSFQVEKIGIPEYIQFNEVWGSFHISFCDHLQNPIINSKVAERGAVGFGPKIVHGKYWVSYNNELEDLRGCPEIVEGEFVCIHNSWLKTFDYFPKRVEGDFTYYSNGLELDYEGTLFDGRIGNGWTPERLRNTYYIGGKIDDGNK